jgi:hypothetical protein
MKPASSQARASARWGLPAVFALTTWAVGFVAATWPSAISRAQSVAMGADGAIHLDQFSQVDPSTPVVINQAPQVIPQWDATGQPMMCPPGYQCAPQCVQCTPYVAQPTYVTVPQTAATGLMDTVRAADWQWLFGGEFIFARASFSDALAYTVFEVPANSFNFVQMDFDYEPSFSAFGGVYLRGWGGSLIFDFTRLESSSDFAAVSDAANFIVTPLPLGLHVTGSADVKVESYDLSLTKSLFFGGPYNFPTGQAAWQPKYELAFSGAIRYADVEWNRQINSFTPATGALFNTTTTSLDFQGIGPRVGLLGRRYIGKTGFASLYAKGDWSLLYGDIDLNTTSTPFIGYYNSRTTVHQIVPVTEIELGASLHLGRFATLSAGYFWAAWHDLGMRDQFPTPAGFPVANYDDANILGFDGLFARAEVTF